MKPVWELLRENCCLGKYASSTVIDGEKKSVLYIKKNLNVNLKKRK